MIYKIRNIYIFLFLSIPLFLITGPAIPDIIISTGVTALTAGAVIFYALSNLSLDFGPSSNAGFH